MNGYGGRDAVEFDNCVKPTAVVKFMNNDEGSEGDPLGAFIASVVEIMVENDMEGGDASEVI